MKTISELKSQNKIKVEQWLRIKHKDDVYFKPLFNEVMALVDNIHSDLREWAKEWIKELKEVDKMKHNDCIDRLVEGKWSILMRLFELKEEDLK